jgi:hypothetical protein
MAEVTEGMTAAEIKNLVYNNAATLYGIGAP